MLLFLYKAITKPKLYIFEIHFHTKFQDPTFRASRDVSTSEVRVTVVLIVVPLGHEEVQRQVNL
jgi:hypothetical protein